MSRENVSMLRERRNNRYEAIKDRIDFYQDEAKVYKNQQAKKLMTDAVDLFKKYSDKVSKVGDGTSYSRYLTVATQEKDSFIDTLINSIREANEIFIEKDLNDLKKQLSYEYLENNIEYFDIQAQAKYKNAVNMLTHLSMTKRLRELEHELGEIAKDITACINYNDKIEKEMRV